MKILFLNASPRPSGCVSAMLDVMAGEAESLGHEVVRLAVADLRVSPCRGCMGCRASRRCLLPPDDAHRVAELLLASDALVVGAPCYWGNMPGTLKVLFDRVVYALIGEGRMGLPAPLHKGKRAVIATASTTPFPFNVMFGQTSGVVRSLKEILGHSGYKIAAAVQRGGTRARPELTAADVSRCRKAVRRLLPRRCQG